MLFMKEQKSREDSYKECFQIEFLLFIPEIAYTCLSSVV